MIDNDADFPLTQEAEDFLAIIERRIEQGLAHYPFPDGAWSGLIKLNEDGTPYNPSYDEILRLVSGWFVKKDNKFHDVNNLQTTYQAQDLKQVIVSRIKVLFPKLELTNKDLKDFFLVLLDPPISNANPERNIPVWSGHTVSLPANTQKISFSDGVATVNLWEYPAYRRAKGVKGTAFEEYLAYVIPDEAERAIFLNWLAWSLKHENQKPRWAVMLYSQRQGTGKTVLTELVKDRPEVHPHEVLTDKQVSVLLGAKDSVLHSTLLFGLFTGMRSGEICGLMAEDVTAKGNLGRFVSIRPNRVRLLKSKAAEREVPLHGVLEGLLDTALPTSGRLFPHLSVDKVVKRYANLRRRHPELRGTVFHSTRKWFITQCERTGVPEHFTASLVGHHSARSANKLTYGLYSAGISGAQKREIIDQIRLPTELAL
jgi:integrase